MSMMLKQRMEAMKQIIEADTDPLKEVCLGATFAPTQQFLLSNLDIRRETMKKIIEADNDPMKEVLHLRAIFGPRRETMKEIIEADTNPMKEVLYLWATFAPTPTQKIMLSNLG